MARPTIVFDLDGTLVDTAPDLLASLNHCLDSVDLPVVDERDIRRYVGFGSRTMIERAYEAHGRHLREGELDALQELFLRHYEDGMPGLSKPFPGVEDALARFADAGWTLAVCTNKYEGLSRRLLTGLALDGHFGVICGADTFEYRKPDPRHLTSTIERIGGDSARAIMVGDSETDIDTAKAAGIPVVAVDFGYTNRPVAELGPSQVISSYDELSLELADRLLSAAAA
jgi:phosphoglycolate phosphatase